MTNEKEVVINFYNIVSSKGASRAGEKKQVQINIPETREYLEQVGPKSPPLQGSWQLTVTNLEVYL